MAKKSTAKNTKQKLTNEESLAKELRSLIPKLDAEGLTYLIEQASIHIYNMKVDEHNRAILAAAEKPSAGKTSKSGKAGKSAKTSATKQKPENAGFTIKGTESGSSYYLYYQNKNIMFSQSEMTHLVKIVNAPGTELEIRERLFNWFHRERKDIFSFINMKNRFDDRLKEISAVIKKSFKLRN